MGKKKREDPEVKPKIQNIEVGVAPDQEPAQSVKAKRVKNKSFTMEQTFKDELLMNLLFYIGNPGLSPEAKTQIQEVYDFINTQIKELNPTIKDRTGSIACVSQEGVTPQQIKKHLNRDDIMGFIIGILEEGWIRELNIWRGRTIIMRGGQIKILPREKRKKSKDKIRIRTGAYLIDNILKSRKPKGIKSKNVQLSIFDTMLQETRDRVISSGTSIDLLNRKGEGIRLTKGEYRILLSLSNILHEKSQTIDPKAEDYYTGNGEVGLVPYKTPQGEISLKSPRISFTLYEITKEFHGGESIGGEQVRKVAKLLYDIADLPDKKALIRYTRKVDKGGGMVREWNIESYESLIKIMTVGYKDILNGKQIDEKKEIVVNLHPIFIDQIADKYVELPIDLTKRMIEANGSSNISEITTKFILELARGYSGRRILTKDQNNNPIYRIGQETLFYKIAEGYMPPERKRIPLIEQYFTKAIETAKAIGLLLSYEIRPGTDGGNIYYFTLFKDWE